MEDSELDIQWKPSTLMFEQVRTKRKEVEGICFKIQKTIVACILYKYHVSMSRVDDLLKLNNRQAY